MRKLLKTKEDYLKEVKSSDGVRQRHLLEMLHDRIIDELNYSLNSFKYEVTKSRFMYVPLFIGNLWKTGTGLGECIEDDHYFRKSLSSLVANTLSESGWKLSKFHMTVIKPNLEDTSYGKLEISLKLEI